MNILCSVLVVLSVYCCIISAAAPPASSLDEDPIGESKRAGRYTTKQAPMRFGKRSDPGLEDDLLRMTRTPMRYVSMY